jgi:hypothetical protein
MILLVPSKDIAQKSMEILFFLESNCVVMGTAAPVVVVVVVGITCNERIVWWKSVRVR